MTKRPGSHINTSNLRDPGYMGRIKAAIERAIIKANRPDAVRGLGHAEVYNSRDKPSLQIVARKGGGFEVFDQNDIDITDAVKAALKQYHGQGKEE